MRTPDTDRRILDRIQERLVWLNGYSSENDYHEGVRFAAMMIAYEIRHVRALAGWETRRRKAKKPRK